MTNLMIKSKGRSESIVLPDLTAEEINKFNSMADAIRYVSKKYPKASCGSIANLLSKYHDKKVRPQHVYNVQHQILKTKQ